MLQQAKNVFFIVTLLAVFYFSGCVATEQNVGEMAKFGVPSVEAQWIRDGEPLEFEGEQWSPQDDIEILLDSEVYLLGEYKEIQFFVEKRDVRPYDYLYTKFGRNKYRIFERKY